MINIFGSINMDIVFSVHELPRPGETILCPHYKLIPGGKGANQAVAVARTLPSLSSYPVSFFGRIGEDDFGNKLQKDLHQEGINLKGLLKSKYPTGCASIWVDHKGENSIVVASGANLEASHKDIPDTHLLENSFLLLQLETPLSENCLLIKRAFEKKVHIILNCAPAFPIASEILQCVSTLILNETEAQMMAQNLHITFVSLKDLTIQLARICEKVCIITLGAQGLVAATHDIFYQLDAYKITPIDTTGAGDTFIGALVSQLAQNIPLPQALQFASFASSLACLKIGAQSSIPHYEEIQKKSVVMPPHQEEKIF